MDDDDGHTTYTVRNLIVLFSEKSHEIANDSLDVTIPSRERDIILANAVGHKFIVYTETNSSKIDLVKSKVTEDKSHGIENIIVLSLILDEATESSKVVAQFSRPIGVGPPKGENYDSRIYHSY